MTWKRTRKIRIAKVKSETFLRRRNSIAAEFTPELEKLWRELVRATGGQIDSTLLRNSIAEGNLLAADLAVPFEQLLESFYRPRMSTTLSDIFRATGTATVRLVGRDLGLPGSALTFDPTTDAVQRYIKNEVGRLIVEVGSTKRAVVKGFIQEAGRRGLNIAQTAALIEESRVFGLTSQDSRAVLNFGTRLRREGVDESAVLILMDRRARKKEKQRAERIARTELVRTFSVGEQEGWAQMAALGTLGPEARQQWLTIEPCEICAPLDGVVVPLGELFYPGGFAKPGDPHPRCECYVTLLPFGDEGELAA